MSERTLRRRVRRVGASAHAAPGMNAADVPIRIGVSTCLLGEQVRFDGGHKRDAFLVDMLGRYVEWVPVCPEVEAGLGVPRETMHLRRIGEDVRLVTTRTGIDHTDTLRRYAARRVAALRAQDLCGYVLKKGSPSCGMQRVKIYGRHGPIASGRGVFAEALLQAYPHLPVEEEGRLNDPRLRENFVERIFAYRRLRSLFGSRWTIAHLVAFHTAHKLQLMAHSPRQYAELGRLVAGAKRLERPVLEASYAAQFMDALDVMATPKRQVNVLQHMLGYFSDRLDGAARRELIELIEDYGRGTLPLVVPLTLVRHYVRQFAIAYLETQTYLQPHPKELMLRNHV
jgi:uncharacterized protein YbgA (DUF1722 family)/uncharacterized protein YbbK (DUF523 family)